MASAARPLILEHDAEIEPVERDLAVQAQREPVVALGPGQLAAVVQDAADVVVRVGQVGTARERPAVGIERGRRIVRLEGTATVVPGDGAGPLAEATPGSEAEKDEIAHDPNLTIGSDTGPPEPTIPRVRMSGQWAIRTGRR